MAMLFPLTLRIASLALKFMLTIVLARTLGFAAVAAYGLALAASVVSSKLLGLGFSTEINRRLSLVNPGGAMRDAGRLILFYCVVYGAIGALVAMLYGTHTVGQLDRIAPGILWGVTLVSFSEHAGLETTSYVFSLRRSRAGVVLLFIRTGAWAGVAVIGLLAGLIRSIETIFTLWWGTNVIAVCAACWCIRLKGREEHLTRSRAVPNAAEGMRSVWVDGLPFFVATTVLSGLQYAERFLASGVVAVDALGRYVFVWSISNAIQTIAYATIVVIAGPRLVRSLSGANGEFRATLRASVRSSAGITLVGAAMIFMARKQIFHLANVLGDSEEYIMLLTLLLSFVLRAITDIYWSAAVALQLGKQVVVTICLAAAICVPVEWILVTRLGAVGASLAHLTASITILALVGLLVAQAQSQRTVESSKEETAHVA